MTLPDALPMLELAKLAIKHENYEDAVNWIDAFINEMKTLPPCDHDECGVTECRIEEDYWKKNNITKPPQRIVCAAIKNKVTDEIILGIRHFDQFMREQIERREHHQDRAIWKRAEQGFVDQFGDFLTREEAYIIAKENGQIIRPDGTHDDKTLYSECLY